MRASILPGLLLLAGTAHAGFITLEPDDYAAGTNVSNVVAGISLSAVRSSTGPGGELEFNLSDPVFAVDSPAAVTGTRLLGSAPTNTVWERPDPFFTTDGPTLRADFSGGAVTSVEFLWSDFECGSITDCADIALMKIFDSSDNLLATCSFLTSSPGTGCDDAALGFINGPGPGIAGFSWSYTNTSGNIAYAMIGNAVQVDRVRIEVPEPATLGLFAACLIALRWRVYARGTARTLRSQVLRSATSS